jgi:hypothetical protein
VTAVAGLHALPNPRSEPLPIPTEFGPIRPSLLSVWPSEDGFFGIDVCWHGRECILRAVVVRRLLAESGLDARMGNSQDGRTWELKIERVPSGRVAKVIDQIIW